MKFFVGVTDNNWYNYALYIGNTFADYE